MSTMKEVTRGIEIDFSDHEAMCKVMDNYHKTQTMLFGENEEGEMTTASIFEDKIVLVTFQSNHWLRKNIYHRDGTVEEMFEGKWE